MNKPNLTWFYFHCVLALTIIATDYTGHLEPFVNDFERKIGLYTPPDTTQYEEPSIYNAPPFDFDDGLPIDSVYVDRGSK